MSPWFASVLLLLAYNFTGIFPTDLEIDGSGTVWVLSSASPLVIRLSPDGTTDSYSLDIPGFASGLAISPTGRWAVSSSASGVILVHDTDDILTAEIPVESPGDLVWNGLDIWFVNTSSGNLETPDGTILARDCAGRNTRLSSGGFGRVLLSGSRGVFLVEEGRGKTLVAGSGYGCFSAGEILLLGGGTVLNQSGDTIAVDVPGTRLSSSPSGGTVVVWGGTVPSVLE